MTEGDHPIPDPTETENSQQRIIEVEGPVDLVSDDNFYAQPPFAQLIEEFVREPVAEGSAPFFKQDFRYVLTKLAKILFDIKTQPELIKRFYEKVLNPDVPSEARQDNLVLLSSLMPQGKQTVPYRKTAQRAIADFSTSLDDYPDWESYIEGNLTANGYKFDGNHTSGKTAKPIPSFMSWLEDRTTRGIRLAKGARVIGIDLVFPQQVQGQPLTEAVPDSGVRRHTRKWKIIQAVDPHTRRTR